jgi:hydroxypyruvate isomerase
MIDMICFWLSSDLPQAPEPEWRRQSAREERDIPVLRRSGNLSSLLGRKIPCSSAQGILVESFGIVKLFGAVLPKNDQRAKDSLLFSLMPGNSAALRAGVPFHAIGEDCSVRAAVLAPAVRWRAASSLRPRPLSQFKEGFMPKFAANLTMLFTELPFLDRFAAAAAAGFDAVEFLFPYDFDKQRLAGLLKDHGLTLVLHNLPAGDWTAGERGIACHPDRVAEFRAGVDRAIDYAKALACPKVNCLAGILPAGVTAESARATLVDNLRYAAGRLEAAGVGLLLEPVNSRDIPGFFVDRTAPALEIIEAVGSKNLKLQYDIYHTQVMEGDLARTLETQFARIGHIQLADNPGRHEPGTGEINFPFLFRRIDELGYAGWIGCEYKPLGATTSGLTWLAPYRTAGYAAALA